MYFSSPKIVFGEFWYPFLSKTSDNSCRHWVIVWNKVTREQGHENPGKARARDVGIVLVI